MEMEKYLAKHVVEQVIFIILKIIFLHAKSVMVQDI